MKAWSPADSEAGRSRSLLALRELEAAAGLGAAVFLALDHAAVAREKAALLEHRSQLRLEEGQRLRQAVTHCSRLPREATAGNGADNVELLHAACSLEGLLDQHAQRGTREINGKLL